MDKSTKGRVVPVHAEITRCIREHKTCADAHINGQTYREDSGNVYDNHCVFLRTDMCTALQIRKAIDTALAKLCAEHSLVPPLQNEYILNVVTDSKEEYIGRSFVHFRDARVYNAFVGYNFDGTRRVERKQDPSWVPPVKKVTSEKRRWGDEEDDTPPQIEVHLPPLITLPPIKDLAEEQRRGKGAAFCIPVCPAFVTLGISKGYSMDILKVYGIAPAILPRAYDLLMKIFARYAHTQRGQKSYPIIIINPPRVEGHDGTARIIFASHIDSQFARLMQKKTYLLDDKTGKQYVLNCHQAKDYRREKVV